jgi:diketogulonate reductase-like aldo/keto reductase
MRTVAAAGVEIPLLGFGTWQITGERCALMVEHALKLGYRHLDTAAAYENEREVGQGLRASGVARDEVFLTTKIWRDAMRDGELQRAAEASLQRLGVDRVDLLLIHWPNPDVPLAETMKALAEVKRAGLARAIGVSNFPSALVEAAARACPEPLATDQVEFHPYLAQDRLRRTLADFRMALTAYSPLARGRVARDPRIAEIAARHGRSSGQVVLRWLIQQGVVAIPKTSSPERAAENLAVFDFELPAQDMAALSALARPDGRVIDPSFAPEWDAV